MSEAARVLESLDPEQRQVAETVRGPVCVLAGAGTGKTRAITHRIAYAVLTGAVPAGQLLAVTFTTRAAAEMRHRLAGLGVAGVQARTFHSAALRQVQYFWPRLVGGPLPQVVDSKARLVVAAAGRHGVPLGPAETRDLAAEVEWAKTALVGPADYPAAAAAAGRTPPLPADAVARLYAGYEEAKRQRGLLDFEDLLLVAAAGIEDHRDVADEVRARYRHFVVDEYQDVSPLQQRLLDAWLGGRDDVCVVGDASQTIYSFAGASPRFLTGFTARYQQATVVRLVRDYRSTPQVVAVANTLQPPGPGRTRLVAQRRDGPAPVLRGFPDELAEAAAVAARCRRLVADGVPANEIAVLFRVNAQSEPHEQALARAGVAYQLHAAERFFDRPAVRQAVLLLRAAARAEPDGQPDPLVDQVTTVLAAAGWRPDPPAGAGAVRERWESLHALVGLADEYTGSAGDPGGGLPGFVAELERRAARQQPPPVAGVTLASLHAAKGLEWDAVFVTGLAEGTLPISYAVTAEQLAEERRLLYVGVTRAREYLWLSWAAARAPGGRRGREPSRFLTGLLPRGRAARQAAAPRDGTRRAAAPRDGTRRAARTGRGRRPR